MPRLGSARGKAAKLLGALLLAWLVATPARFAFAQAKTVTLDAITLEPTRLPGFSRLRAYVSAMSLEGDLLAIDLAGLQLQVGSSPLRAPRGVGRFAASDAELSVVIIIEATLEYAPVFPLLQEVLTEELLTKLPDRTRVAVVGYGETVQSGRLNNVRAARARLSSLSPDTAPSDPALLEAVEHGLSLFRRVKTTPPGRPMRKVIVLLSDGRDRLLDRERVTSVGQRANRDGVRILSLAYSPTNTRRPLLNLGELSKQSRGTFRWLRTGEKQSWQTQLHRVFEQIEQQIVLTYFVEQGDELDRLIGKRATVSLAVGSSELVSNELKVPKPGCAQSACEGEQWCQAGVCVTPRRSGGGGLAGWLATLLGIGAALLIVLGALGYVMARRQAQQVGGVGAVPGSRPPPGVAPPGSVPPGSMPPAATGAYAPGAHAPAPAAPVTGPSLYIASGPRAGTRIALFHGFSIGKAPDCSLVIDDGYASSHHAQIGLDGRGFCTIYDRGSTNGTFVNGTRVTEMPLEHGSSVRIGATELRFLAE